MKLFAKCPNDKTDIYLKNLNKALIEGDVVSIPRMAAFCAQVCVETDELKSLIENLNYSTSLLMKTWPKRFPTVEIANKYARQPEKLANFVYSNRLGNGSEASGEGWKYRGRGVLQTTGKDNYKDASQISGVDLVLDPDKAIDPNYMFKVAISHWNKKKISILADKGDIDGVSKAVNGGTVGLLERREYYKKFMIVLSGAILGI